MFARRAVAPLLGLLLAFALYPGTHGLDAIAREGQLGPGFWPRLALLGLAVACVAKIVEEWRRARATARMVASAPKALAEISRGKLTLAIGFIILFVLAVPFLGFPLVTALFIAAFLGLGGMRSMSGVVANVVIGTGMLLYLFVKFVYLPLPKGTGPFEAMTLALYRALHLF